MKTLHAALVITVLAAPVVAAHAQDAAPLRLVESMAGSGMALVLALLTGNLRWG
jgi:hypothetical protein